MVELRIVRSDNEDALDYANEVFEHPHADTPWYIRVYSVVLFLTSLVLAFVAVLLVTRAGASLLEWIALGGLSVQVFEGLRAAVHYWRV